MLRKTLLLIFASLLLTQAEAFHRFSSRRIPDKYIVTLRHTDVKAQMRERLAALLDKFEGHHEIEYDYQDLGIAGKLSDELIRAIEAELEGHVDVENDHEVNMHAANTPTSSFPVTANLWGLDRLDQGALPLTRTYTPRALDGTGVTAYVVDTGIFNQREYETRVVGGFDAFSNGAANPTDCNGHGTHVAGTIGAVTYGVAKNVRLVGVRVLNCQGSGSSAGILNGLNYVVRTATGPSVVNMSLGGIGANTQRKINGAYANVFAALNAKNIPIIAAAGNENANACTSTPANEIRAITVGASTITDGLATFSNFGPCVDIIAPGQGIQSTYLNAQVTILSGTSMAAPHVAGVVALMLQANPNLTPEQVRAQLVASGAKGAIGANNVKMNTTPNVLLQLPSTANTPTTPTAPTAPTPSNSARPSTSTTPRPSPSSSRAPTPATPVTPPAPVTPPTPPTPPADGKPTFPWLPGYFFDYLPWELVPDIKDPYIPRAPRNIEVTPLSANEYSFSFDVDPQTTLNCINNVKGQTVDSMCVNRVDSCGQDERTNTTRCTIMGGYDASAGYTVTITSKSFEGGVSQPAAVEGMISASGVSGVKIASGLASVVLGAMTYMFL